MLRKETCFLFVRRVVLGRAAGRQWGAPEYFSVGMTSLGLHLENELTAVKVGGSEGRHGQFKTVTIFGYIQSYCGYKIV